MSATIAPTPNCHIRPKVTKYAGAGLVIVKITQNTKDATVTTASAMMTARRSDPRKRFTREPGREQHQKRPHHIELLFERQRPVVLHSGRVAAVVQVVGGVEREVPVLDVEGRREDLADLVRQGRRRREVGRHRDERAEQEHQQRCRQQASGSPRPELPQPHGSRRGQLAHQVRGDQESRDHEEDVDTDVSAGEAGRPEVVEHHRQDGDRPQALNVRDETRGLRVLRRTVERFAQDGP